MRTVAVIDYDKQWPELFEAENSRLQLLLGKVVIRIHHIGSTSVPGLAAKPVIDIMLEVVGLSELDSYNTMMQRAGYVARGENGIPGRRYFVKGGDNRSHQLHAFVTGDMQIVKHLAFRDYLIKNHPIAVQYAGIKRAAALACKNDIHRYSAIKADFIAHHLRLALAHLEP